MCYYILQVIGEIREFEEGPGQNLSCAYNFSFLSNMHTAGRLKVIGYIFFKHYKVVRILKLLCKFLHLKNNCINKMNIARLIKYLCSHNTFIM